jgi:hypothetical protein
MRKQLLIAIAGLIALSLSSHARIGLVTIPARQDIRIKIDRNNNALVQEQRDITVKQGENRIEFSWPNMQIDFNTVQLIPLANEDSISVLSVAVPPNANNTLVLDVDSREPSEIPFRITYLTGGLSWQSDYIAVADVDEQFLTLDANVTITNGTVEDYHDAEFELPVGKPFRQFIQSGESKKITLFTVSRIPVDKTYTSDPREHADAVAMHYVFHNDPEHGLDQGMLLPGRVRQFKKDATGSVAFLGEDVLSFVPSGSEIKLYQGPARDIEVERTVMKRERKKLRRNKKGRIVSYDTDESYRIKVQNRKLADAPLIIRAYLSQYWKMKSHSDDYERTDASTIEFKVTVPGRSEREITFDVEGINLQGGYVLSD